MPRPDPFVQAERHLQRGLARLPAWLSRFLGYRGKPLPPSPTYIVCLWGFIGALGGLGILFAIFGHTTFFSSRAVPPIIASYVRNAFCLTSMFTDVLQRVLLLYSVTALLTSLWPSRAISSLATSSAPSSA